MTLTPELLAELRRKAETATPGPWEWQDGSLKSTGLPTAWGHETILDPHNCAYPSETPSDALGSIGNVAEARKAETAEFIAAANPAVVLALLDRIGELEADRKTVAHELSCEVTACSYAAQAAVSRVAKLERCLAEAPDHWENGEPFEKDFTL